MCLAALLCEQFLPIREWGGATKTNFYLNIFHQQMVKLFEATDKNLHTGLSKKDLGDILAEIDDLKVTYNCVDGKLLHVNQIT